MLFWNKNGNENVHKRIIHVVTMSTDAFDITGEWIPARQGFLQQWITG